MNENRTTTPAARWRAFPNALDFIVLTVWVFFSQSIVATIVLACGAVIPDLAAVSNADAEVSLAASLDTARMLTLIYAPSMLLSILGALLYRCLRGARGRIARFSAAGLNPSLLLSGFVWMIAAGIVSEPLLDMLPDIPDTVGRGFLALLTTVVLAPLFEEFLCRGIILESFRRKYGVVAGWLCSSIFFALIHGQITSMTNALIIGSIIGYICIRSRSLFSSVILHALNNGLALMTISLGFGNASLSELLPDRRIYYAVYGVSAAICIAGAAAMLTTFAKMRREEVATAQKQ